MLLGFAGDIDLVGINRRAQEEVMLLCGGKQRGKGSTNAFRGQLANELRSA